MPQTYYPITLYDKDGNAVPCPVIRGEKYVLTSADKQEIAEIVIDNLSTETWTFTLENGSTVTKTVVLQ